jgi:hypothetical protein
LGPRHSAPAPLDVLALVLLPPPAPPPGDEGPHAATSSESTEEQQSVDTIFKSLITKPPPVSFSEFHPLDHAYFVLVDPGGPLDAIGVRAARGRFDEAPRRGTCAPAIPWLARASARITAASSAS